MRNTPLYLVLLFLFALFLFPGDSSKAFTPGNNSLSKSMMVDSVLTKGFTFSQIGEASSYGSEFANKTTSSGEKYNKDDYTAAHPFLEFGTCLRVTNLKNDREVVVRVNDRGPKKKGRILDLSAAAAHDLGLGEDGTGQVKIETLAEPMGPEQKEVVIFEDNVLAGEKYSITFLGHEDSSRMRNIITSNGKLKISLIRYPSSIKESQVMSREGALKNNNPIIKSKEGQAFSVQVGVFVNPNNAEELQKMLEKKGYKDIKVFKITDKSNVLYKVSIGNFDTYEKAVEFKTKLLRNNIVGYIIMKG
jgi:rare lipoprotein A